MFYGFSVGAIFATVSEGRRGCRWHVLALPRFPLITVFSAPNYAPFLKGMQGPDRSSLELFGVSSIVSPCTRIGTYAEPEQSLQRPQSPATQLSARMR